jgi:hypothetical protein
VDNLEAAAGKVLKGKGMENSGKKVEPAVKVYDTGNTDSIRGRRYGTVASQVEREKTVESFQESSSQKNEPFFATDTHRQRRTKP